MKGRDTHIGRNARKVLWARSSSEQRLKEREKGTGKGRGLAGWMEYSNKEERGTRRRKVYTNGAKTRDGRGGEGDATRLINRHADNHSGFMVTTDYQVVQGSIFHIRDVTLFQWGNTCSARYKLHERAYTGRHVCCLRIFSSLSLSLFLLYTHVHTAGEPRRQRTGSKKRRPGAPSLSPPFFLCPPSSRYSGLGPPFVPISPRPSLKIIPTFARARARASLQQWPATFPRDRSSDRSPTTPYIDSIPALEIRARVTLNSQLSTPGRMASLARSAVSQLEFRNHSAERMKLQARYGTAPLLLRERERRSRNCYQNGIATLPLLRPLRPRSYENTRYPVFNPSSRDPPSVICNVFLLARNPLTRSSSFFEATTLGKTTVHSAINRSNSSLKLSFVSFGLFRFPFSSECRAFRNR